MSVIFDCGVSCQKGWQLTIVIPQVQEERELLAKEKAEKLAERERKEKEKEQKRMKKEQNSRFGHLFSK